MPLLMVQQNSVQPSVQSAAAAVGDVGVRRCPAACPARTRRPRPRSPTIAEPMRNPRRLDLRSSSAGGLAHEPVRERDALAPRGRRGHSVTRRPLGRRPCVFGQRGEREEHERTSDRHEDQERDTEQRLVGEHVGERRRRRRTRPRPRRPANGEVEHHVHDARRGVDLAEASARADRRSGAQRQHHEDGEREVETATSAAKHGTADEQRADADHGLDRPRRARRAGRHAEDRPRSACAVSRGRTALSAPPTARSTAAIANGPARTLTGGSRRPGSVDAVRPSAGVGAVDPSTAMASLSTSSPRSRRRRPTSAWRASETSGASRSCTKWCNNVRSSRRGIGRSAARVAGRMRCRPARAP